MDVATARLILHLLTVPEAQRIVDSKPNSEEFWHPQYPFADELDALRPFVAAPVAGSIFGPWVIREASGLAVGGIGFFGPPDATGAVELGYGLVPAARGRGYATEAVSRALEIARDAGARIVTAGTTAENRASIRVLEKTGFVGAGSVDGELRFRSEL